MSWDDPNIYYNPEAFGLEVVAEIEYSDRYYVFDTRVVWRDTKTGILYTMRDSGCSCPTPFEQYHSLAELDRLDVTVLRDEARAALAPKYGDANVTFAEVEHFVLTIAAAAARASELGLKRAASNLEKKL